MEKKVKICDICKTQLSNQKCIMCEKDVCDHIQCSTHLVKLNKDYAEFKQLDKFNKGRCCMSCARKINSFEGKDELFIESVEKMIQDYCERLKKEILIEAI
jgi:hypothetical protein